MGASSVSIGVTVLLVCIGAALGSSLFFLIRDVSGKTRTVRALTVRVGLSLALFCGLFVAFAQGWIAPHAL